MPNTTTNYALFKPLVNDATDEDLWGGYLNDSMDLIDTQMKVNADAIITASQLPVGSYYMNETVSTNPGTLLGYGTWVAVGDKMIIGASGTYAAGSTGGSATHTNTVGEMVAHTHVQTQNTTGSGSAYNFGGANQNATPTNATNSTASAGSGSAYSILNPYIAAYIWKRTV